MSFLPPRFAFGFDIFIIEAGLVLAALCLAFVMPQLGDGFFRRIEAAFLRLARKWPRLERQGAGLPKFSGLPEQSTALVLAGACEALLYLWFHPASELLFYCLEARRTAMLGSSTRGSGR